MANTTNRVFWTGFWDDPDFEESGPFEKYIYGFLFTAPSSAICGYYQCTYKTISDKTGVPIAEVKKAISYLDSLGKIVFDSGLIFVKGMARRQDGETLYTFSEHCAKQHREIYKPGNRAFEAFTQRFEKEIFNPKNRKSNKINAEILKPIQSLQIANAKPLNSSDRKWEIEIGNRISLEEGSGEKPLENSRTQDIAPAEDSKIETAPVEKNQQRYFEAKEMFREYFEPDRQILTPMKEREFSTALTACGVEGIPKLLEAIKICSAEGWKSFASLMDYLSGKLKPKRERYAKNERPSPKYIPPKKRGPDKPLEAIPDDVQKVLDSLSGKFRPKQPDQSKALPIQDDSPLPDAKSFLSDEDISMMREVQASAKKRLKEAT